MWIIRFVVVRVCFIIESLYQLGKMTFIQSAKYLQLRENVVYEGWVQWATNKLNFDNLVSSWTCVYGFIHIFQDIDPCGWSYEPDVYWHVFHDEEQDLKTVRQAHAYLREEVVVVIVVVVNISFRPKN